MTTTNSYNLIRALNHVQEPIHVGGALGKYYNAAPSATP
jgi:hypothetical protein